MCCFKRRRKISDTEAIIASVKDEIKKLRALEEILASANSGEGELARLKNEAQEWLRKSVKLLSDGEETLSITLPPRRRGRAKALQKDMLAALDEIDGVLFDCVLHCFLIEQKIYPLAQKFAALVEENAIS
ncbi:MAG: hypothetical protein IJ514_07070 [Clostridia bacterium]|nr:hypothetical protein [Clostridia bacterium]